MVTIHITASSDSIGSLINLRIKHKVLTLVYKSLHGQAPEYFQDLLQIQTPRRTGLRSGNGLCLSVPFTQRKTFAERSFSIAGPKWWNELPITVKEATNAETFKHI